MGKMGGFSASDLKKLQRQLNEMGQNDADAFVDSCAKALASRLLSKVIPRTPVGQYPKKSGKKGGSLRRGWTSVTQEEAASGRGSGKSKINAYGESLKVNYFGGTVVIEIVNPVEYASYVEYGHRTANHQGWVQGRFMLTISEQEIQNIAPKVLESKIKKFLGECMK